MMLVAFGQKKMFKRFIPAFLHFFIYVGFLVINLEVLEFVIDGLAGTHRIFAPYLGGFYNVLMNIFEFLAVAVLFACVVMLVRRNVLKIKRFWSAEMTALAKTRCQHYSYYRNHFDVCNSYHECRGSGFARKRSHITPHTGTLFFSGQLIPLLQSFNTSTLIVIERVAWWFHIIGILGFAVYITYSKHLHIFLAFPNTYFANLERKGHINNMPVVTNEVKIDAGLD